jgi:hypothetical protein
VCLSQYVVSDFYKSDKIVVFQDVCHVSLPSCHPVVLGCICLIAATTLSFGHDPNERRIPNTRKFYYWCADPLLSVRSILKCYCLRKLSRVWSHHNRLCFLLRRVFIKWLPMTLLFNVSYFLSLVQHAL